MDSRKGGMMPCDRFNSRERHSLGSKLHLNLRQHRKGNCELHQLRRLTGPELKWPDFLFVAVLPVPQRDVLHGFRQC